MIALYCLVFTVCLRFRFAVFNFESSVCENIVVDWWLCNFHTQFVDWWMTFAVCWLGVLESRLVTAFSVNKKAVISNATHLNCKVWTRHSNCCEPQTADRKAKQNIRDLQTTNSRIYRSQYRSQATNCTRHNSGESENNKQQPIAHDKLQQQIVNCRQTINCNH